MKIFYLYIVFLINVCLAHSQNDTLYLHYDIGEYKINKKNYDKLLNKLNQLPKNKNINVDIISSCDFLGNKKQNFTLSKKRALTVKKLIELQNNLTITSIKHKGIGELKIGNREQTTKGFIDDRKTVLIFKDDTQHILDKIIKAKKGDTFVLRDIHFEPGRHLLKKQSLQVLKRLLKILKENPKLEIELIGHVCCGKDIKDSLDGYDKDTKDFNLSKNRAKHIYKYLIYKKIDSNRLSHNGYGFLKPLFYPEENELHKKLNRRVEIKVVNNP
jgi:outer membrane protein OmpA-like peptidoglycan-associated protein